MQRDTIPSDEELACRAQQGCAASFEELVRRFQVPLLLFLRKRTSPAGSGHADAEDLLQDTFVRAYENLDKYRSSWRFGTWVYTIARRLSINHYRRRRLEPCENVEAIRSAAPSPEEVVAEAESRRQLWDLAAETLTEEQMTALWLYYVEQMPVKEIAMVQGRSRASVKTMLFRARGKLSPVLESMESDGPHSNHDPTNDRKATSKLACQSRTGGPACHSRAGGNPSV